jgi:hypothetical protein
MQISGFLMQGLGSNFLQDSTEIEISESGLKILGS